MNIFKGLFRKPFFLKCQLFCQNGFHLWKMRWLMILWNVTNILTVVWFYFLSLFYIATKSPLLMFFTTVYSFGSSPRVLPLFVAVSFHEKITFHSAAAAIMSSSTLRVEELDDGNRHYYYIRTTTTNTYYVDSRLLCKLKWGREREKEKNSNWISIFWWTISLY